MKEKTIQQVKVELMAQVALSHPDVSVNMCLYTDASDSHWDAVITNVPKVKRTLRWWIKNTIRLL